MPCKSEQTDFDADTLNRLVPSIYHELRALAYQLFQAERPNHTLQPTAVAHEAYIRLVEQNRAPWSSRDQFIASAAYMIRRILVDHARKHKAAKRGGGRRHVPLDDQIATQQNRDTSLVDLDEALVRLAEFDLRKSKIIELRFFAGLTEEETGELLGISPRTVRREWRLARAWLSRELDGRIGDDA